MDDRRRRSRLGTIGTLAGVVLIVASACTSGASPSTGGATRRPRAPEVAPRAVPRRQPGSRHEARRDRQQGHDRRRDQGRDRGRGLADVGNWTYSATSEIVNQPVPST